MRISRVRVALTITAAAVCTVAATARAVVARSPDPRVSNTRGAGPDVVLISGLLGGTARLAPLGDSLERAGFRVTTIDPYALGADAADVSFHGMARQIDSLLAANEVESAVIVAHGHATSIALCLAAESPERVQQLVLLDGGVLASPSSPGITRALRIASFVAHLPFGKAFIRSRVVADIRANSGDTRWLTKAVAREYTDPIITRLPEVTRLARRLAAAREVETPAALVARVHTDIMLLVGAKPHESEPDPNELAPLAALSTVRIERIAGVGHFMYEEIPSTIVRAVQDAHSRSVAESR
jgi:pimeloyl-ACP methyl ester carboxylesterase